MADKKILKVLVIHGYRQSAKTSKEKTGAFRKGLKKYLECVFITAPNKIPGSNSEDSEEYGWWFSKGGEEEDSSFNATEPTNIDKGHNASVELIKKTIEEQGPFDGILGFSQGATMAAHICCLATEEGSFNFKFAILCAGFKSRSSIHGKYYKEISIPSLHVFGDSDQVIPKEMSLELVNMFTDNTTINHTGGHYLPASAVERKHYQQFLDRFNNHPS